MWSWPACRAVAGRDRYRRRKCSASRLICVGVVLVSRSHRMKPFLPFTRPSIDADSIAAVAEVFSSGQLASGPKVHAFEAALAAYLGAAPRARDDLGDRGTRDGARGRRHRRGRRGHRAGDEFCGERECGGAAAGQAGIRRHRSRDPQFRRGLARGRHQPQDARHHAGAFLGAAGRYGCLVRDCRRARICAWSRMRRMPSAPATAAS